MRIAGTNAGSSSKGKSPGSASDSELVRKAVAAAKRGDRDGVHFLYARFAEDIQRYVRSFVKDHHQAEDITQDVFIKLMRVIGKYEEREVPFSAWILRVARNAALDHLRVQRAVPRAEIHLADDEQGQISRERGRALRDALRQLPDDQREVLVLRHILGLSPTEIATVLGRTESSVHGLHHRGRLTFRSALQDFGAAPVTTAERSL